MGAVNAVGFNYVPVYGAYERAQRRALRTQRKTMLRFFQSRGMAGLAFDLKNLRDNSRMHGDTKMRIFRSILDVYASLVTASRAKENEPAEAAHQPPTRSVGVSSEGGPNVETPGRL